MMRIFLAKFSLNNGAHIREELTSRMPFSSRESSFRRAG